MILLRNGRKEALIMGPNENLEHGRHRPDCDTKVTCSFEQLLCVEFDVVFDIDVELENIEVSCGDGIRGRMNVKDD